MSPFGEMSVRGNVFLGNVLRGNSLEPNALLCEAISMSSVDGYVNYGLGIVVSEEDISQRNVSL